MDGFFDNSIFGMESAKVFEDFKRKSDKALQHKFAGQIKGNFLIAIKKAILKQIMPEIANYYDLTMTDEKLVSNGNEMVDYDICRHIVGIHRSKLIFETIDKRKQLEGSSDYQKELVREVINQIMVRMRVRRVRWKVRWSISKPSRWMSSTLSTARRLRVRAQGIRISWIRYISPCRSGSSILTASCSASRRNGMSTRPKILS